MSGFTGSPNGLISAVDGLAFFRFFFLKKNGVGAGVSGAAENVEAAGTGTGVDVCAGADAGEAVVVVQAESTSVAITDNETTMLFTCAPQLAVVLIVALGRAMSDPSGKLRFMLQTYQLPKRFILDHWDRDLGDREQLLSEDARHMIVALSPDTFAELLSDAEYYVEVGGEMGPAYLGLISGARATINALRKAEMVQSRAS